MGTIKVGQKSPKILAMGGLSIDDDYAVGGEIQHENVAAEMPQAAVQEYRDIDRADIEMAESMVDDSEKAEISEAEQPAEEEAPVGAESPTIAPKTKRRVKKSK